MFDMAMRRVDPSVVSTNSVLDLLTVCYNRFLDSTTEIDKDRYTLIEQLEFYVLKVSYHISRIIGEHYIWRFAQKTLLAGF